MLGNFQSVVLVRKTCPMQDPIHIPVQQAPLRVVSVQEVLDIDNMWFSGTHPRSPASPSIFAGYGDFNIFQLSGQRCLWVHPIVWTKMRQPAQWGPEGMDQTWFLTNLGGFRCEFLKWWTFVVAWGFSVHHFGTLNYFRLATGWNLWCVASSHWLYRLTPLILFCIGLVVMSAKWLPFNLMRWWDNVVQWLQGPSNRS